VVDYLHELPDQRIHAFMIECCWGEHGQPEPKGIQYMGAGPVATSMTVLSSDPVDCDAMAQLPRPCRVDLDPCGWGAGRPGTMRR
jgi:hypothetical protein